MNRIEHEISFGIPSSVDLETFTAFPQVEINESAFGGDGVRTSEGLVKKLSEVNMIRNQIVLNGSSFGVEEWQKQVEYDRFMNEIWIGVVLSLIVISMVFCICSCFLYHQFRHWKQNYRNTIRENHDIESMKLSPEEDDPVPSYTLVSGLPSYEAAIEQLQKSTDRNIATYPSVFKIFTTLEKTSKDCSSEKPWKELITISNCEESAANQADTGECEKALMGGLTC